MKPVANLSEALSWLMSKGCPAPTSTEIMVSNGGPYAIARLYLLYVAKGINLDDVSPWGEVHGTRRIEVDSLLRDPTFALNDLQNAGIAPGDPKVTLKYPN